MDQIGGSLVLKPNLPYPPGVGVGKGAPPLPTHSLQPYPITRNKYSLSFLLLLEINSSKLIAI